MNPDIRNRVILPILLPLMVLGGIAAAVGGIAWMLLFTSHILALVIVMVIAAGIMVAVSLASSIDEKDMTVSRKGVIVMAGLLPIVLGASVTAWSVNGGVETADTGWGRVPHIVAPEGAVVAAQNSQSFCDIATDPTTCTDTQQLALPAQPDSASFFFIYQNLEAGASHNFSIFELAGDASAPEPGAIIFGVAEGSEIIAGPAEKLYEVVGNPFAAGEQYYYNCVVHPAMLGVLTIVEPGAAAA